MSITVSLVNPPVGATHWNAIFYVGVDYYASGVIPISEPGVVTVVGTPDSFRAAVFDSPTPSSPLASKDVYNIAFADGQSYIFNWVTGAFVSETGAGIPIWMWIAAGGIALVALVASSGMLGSKRR